MIKAKAEGPNGPVLLFGISEENVKRMMSGNPVAINLAEMGMHGQILIIYGKTERAIIEELQANGIELPPQHEWHKE